MCLGREGTHVGSPVDVSMVLETHWPMRVYGNGVDQSKVDGMFLAFYVQMHVNL